MNMNDKLVRDLGIDVSKFNLLMAISKDLSPYKENESARSFLERLEARHPGIVREVFGSEEAAEAVITSQIRELNEALRRIRVHKGLMKESHNPSPFVVAVIAQHSGVKAVRGEDHAEWARRVEREMPGAFHFLCPTQEERDRVIRESFSMFWREAGASKARLIGSMLVATVALMVLIMVNNFVTLSMGQTALRAFTGAYVLLLGANIWLSYRMRHVFYRAEAGATLI